MSLVSAIVKARRTMEPLVADKKANTGKYSYKYSSLAAVIDVAVDTLAAEGVLVIQDPGSSDREVWCVTKLIGEDGETLTSDRLSLEYNGEASEMGKRITTLRRYQLMSILGLATEDDEGGSSPLQASSRPTERREPPPVQTSVASPSGTGKAPDSSAPQPHAALELLRGAARKGQSLGNSGASPELLVLSQRIRNEDGKDGELMSTVKAEGKKTSMYEYMKALVGSVVGEGNAEMVLSMLFGRVINSEFPPTVASRFFFDEVGEGQHRKALGEARTIVAKP